MGSTDSFLPGKVKAEVVAVACSAAADPDAEPVEVAKVAATLGDLDRVDSTFVGAAGAGTEDAPLAPIGVEDGATDAGTEDADDGTAGADNGTADADDGTGIADDEADDAEVDARSVVVIADGEVTTVTTGLGGVGLIELNVGTGAGSRTVEGDGVGWDADTDGGLVPEPMGLGTAIATVQVLTSRTASFPWSSLIGVRTITQVWVTAPEPELIV
jgi:hypothetical protein